MDAKKIATKLSPAMVTALVGFHHDGDWGNTRVGTKVALLDRDLVRHSRKGINPDLVTELGSAVLAELGENVSTPPVLRLRDTRTGTVRRILGTSPAANAPHMTTVWVQREGEQGAQGWSADMLMSTWHDLVAIDENGRTNAEAAVEAAHAEALEYAEMIDSDWALFGWMISDCAAPDVAEANIRWLRDAAMTLPISAGMEASTARYYELAKKHGAAVPFVLPRHTGGSEVAEAHAEAMEYATVIEYELDMLDFFAASCDDMESNSGAVRIMRTTVADSPDYGETTPLGVYARLVRKHGVDVVPFLPGRRS